MTRRWFHFQSCAALGALVAVAPPVMVQTTRGPPHIGVLRWGAQGDEAQVGSTDALAAIGYMQGQTIMIEWRFALSREVAQRHAAELSGMNLDLILASATRAAAALRGVAGSTPIVLFGVADPVGAALVQSLHGQGDGYRDSASPVAARQRGDPMRRRPACLRAAPGAGRRAQWRR